MKKIVQFNIIAFIFLCSSNLMAQKTKKMYNFSHVVSTCSYVGSPCCENKVVYFSPVTSYSFDTYGDYNSIRYADESSQEKRLKSKWLKKILANYNTPSEGCLSEYQNSWSSYSETDEKRDEKIRYYKSQGYTIYTKHTFGFSLPKE